MRKREQDSFVEQTVCFPPKIHCLLLGHLITMRLYPTQFTNSIKILVKSHTQAERDGESERGIEKERKKESEGGRQLERQLHMRKVLNYNAMQNLHASVCTMSLPQQLAGLFSVALTNPLSSPVCVCLCVLGFLWLCVQLVLAILFFVVVVVVVLLCCPLCFAQQHENYRSYVLRTAMCEVIAL